MITACLSGWLAVSAVFGLLTCGVLLGAALQRYDERIVWVVKARRTGALMPEVALGIYRRRVDADAVVAAFEPGDDFDHVSVFSEHLK